jgi:ribosomal protein S21
MVVAALVRGAKRAAAAAVAPKQQQRALYIQVREGQDAERVAGRLHGIMNEDGIMKTLMRKRFHEKKWQQRKRKREEQTIRHANRKIGSMIDFILQRKKAYVLAASGLALVLERGRGTDGGFVWMDGWTAASKRRREALWTAGGDNGGQRGRDRLVTRTP